MNQERDQRPASGLWPLAVATLLVGLGCSKAESPRAPKADTKVTATAAAPPAANSATLSEGNELIGTTPPDWQLSEWVNGSPKTLKELRGQVVVVRFWTSPHCPFCAKTMPALQLLADEFSDQPLSVIGAYHAKPVLSVPDMKAPAEIAARWKVRFPIAFDREWKTLRSWWLASRSRQATSVTFVIGKHGKIAFIHPGPVFHPSDDPAETEENRDYVAVRQAIVEQLAR